MKKAETIQLDGRGVDLKQLHEPRDITRPNLARTICVRKPSFDIQAVMLGGG
jgi:hypothetical protein